MNERSVANRAERIDFRRLVESEGRVGEGATFYFTLEARASEDGQWSR